MKILQICDVKGWAIGHLGDITVRHNPHLHFRQLYVHPKEVDADAIQKVRENLDWADIVDLQYWNTARQLLESIPELRRKKLILTHHNQKDLLAYDWKDIDHHVVHTTYSYNVLLEAGYDNTTIIPYGFDLSYFSYSDQEPPVPAVGYCGRIVPWKGLKEIAKACYELGYPLKMMGKMDKPSYWEEIPTEHRNIIDFEFMDASDEDRIDYYRNITCYVGNSGPKHEEGTMPMQEAMACGVPVVTTPSGVADDILEDGHNALIVPYDDYEALKTAIQRMMEDKELRTTIRQNAWNTIKLHTEERMAWEFEKVFHEVMYDPDLYPLVSVVIPMYNNTENVIKILESLTQSNYPHIETIIVDDNSTDPYIDSIFSFIDEHPDMVIKFKSTSENADAYGLAQARNIGVINAQGDFIMFCDSRMCPEKDAVNAFMLRMRTYDKDKKVWLFGEKGAHKDSFVENFSMIRRSHFIRAGMFNERINRYGGMSQELRTRFQWQGFELVYEPLAITKTLSGSHMTKNRRDDIVASKLQLWKMGIK